MAGRKITGVEVRVGGANEVEGAQSMGIGAKPAVSILDQITGAVTGSSDLDFARRGS